MARIEHPGGEGGAGQPAGWNAGQAAAAAEHRSPGPDVRGADFLFAFAAGAAVANIYYVQPLIGLIGPDIGLSPVLASLMVTFTQLGYAAGLILLVPLGDLIENRRLVVLTLLAVSASLAISAFAGSEPAFLAAALVLGCCAVVAQMLVPFAATLSPEAQGGATVGKVISGVMTGILLARPVASLIADFAGWRAVFGVAAILMLCLSALLHWNLPIRRPEGGFAYSRLIASLWPVWRDTPILRRRALYQGAMFAAFSLFWTTVPLLLASPDFGWSQRGIAVFALAGAAGALISPVAGRVADRGWTRPCDRHCAVPCHLLFRCRRVRRHCRFDRASRRGGHSSGRRVYLESRSWPARDLCAWPRDPQPAECSVHGVHVPWRCCRLRHCKRCLFSRRMDCSVLCRRRLCRGCAALLLRRFLLRPLAEERRSAALASCPSRPSCFTSEPHLSRSEAM